MALEEMELVDAAFSTLKDFEGAKGTPFLLIFKLFLAVWYTPEN